ncbi:MAG: 2'-5' RNA ligase family protein [Chitinophagaceae bacterium]|nr:2'-5' RNA ligase family protein [Chitinophagaceae bacterium]MBP8669520.1 2'-5' RNA ligase family protein [Bacteroidia bacterium]MBP9102446.1 2'-5' RNA ligase family protein [Chitinophagaceae bacterium]
MNQKKNLYFIALIPARELREKINLIKRDFALRFNSKAALKVYPHITLKTPFKCPAKEHVELVNWFSELRNFPKAFPISLNGFGTFDNKNSPVVFIKPELSNDLMYLQKELIASFSSLMPDDIHPLDLSYKPHATVAYRDLSPAMFSDSWKEYGNKNFKEIFDVTAFYLLQHDTKKWNIISTLSLEK